jgi:hypothetical protein
MERRLDRERLARLNKHYPLRLASDGTFFSPPVYLTWVKDLFKPRADQNGRLNYQCTILFQPGADLSVLYKEMHRMYTEKGVKPIAAGLTGSGMPTRWIGMHDPILDQGDIGIDKKTGELRTGYVAGAKAIRLKSGKSDKYDYKPLVWTVIDGEKHTFVEPDYDRVFDGVIAIVNFNPFLSPKDPKNWADPTFKKGVNFGIKSALIVDSTVPKFFESGIKRASTDDYDELNIAADDIVNFNTGDGFHAGLLDEGFSENFDDEIPF